MKNTLVVVYSRRSCLVSKNFTKKNPTTNNSICSYICMKCSRILKNMETKFLLKLTINQCKVKLFECLEWREGRACSTDALGEGAVLSIMSAWAFDDRGRMLHPIPLGTMRGELRELYDLDTFFISCFILLNSPSSSPTLDLIFSMSTFKTWFSRTTVTHPSRCIIWLAISSGTVIGPAGAPLSASNTWREPARAVLNCSCSKNRTWRTILSGNLSLWEAWAQASIESFW